MNAQGRFRGRADPPLDTVGREDARRVAQLLRLAQLKAVYTSPLIRARQTAEEIAAVRDLSVQVVLDLTDLDYGAWTGRTPEEVAEVDRGLHDRFLSDPEEVTPPRGESVTTLANRVARALNSIADENVGATVVVVTHELPIRLVIARAAHLTGAFLWTFAVPTGSVTEVAVGSGCVTLIGEIGRGFVA